MSKRVITSVLLFLVFLTAAGVSWFWFKRDAAAPTPSTTVQSTSEESAPAQEERDPTSLSPEETIKERAEYTYEYLKSPGDFRAKDLETKGYITTSLLQKIEGEDQDLMACRSEGQKYADSYSIGEPMVTDSTASVVVTGTYPNSTTKFTTHWVSENKVWKIDNITCSTSG